jgi:pimeloyl-ACP methyl ester carboxylesterase
MRFMLLGRRRSATLSAVAAGVAATWVVATGLVATGVAATGVAAAPVPAQARPDPLHRFEHQTIAWHDCRTNPNDPLAARLAAVGAVCGELTVPLDYRHPDGRTISIAVDRRPATGTAHRRGTLVVNGGGPDESRSAVALAQSGAPALGARYDLVSFDPRFFGLSTPLNCGWPVELEAVSQLATPDRPGFDANVAAVRQLASRCAPYADELPFASTRNVARDLDILRAALGAQRVSYVAPSYGGYLGAVYVQMFGRHVDRMVLDSAPDPNTFGPQFNRDLAATDSAGLARWADWAAQRDAQFHLGDTTASVLHTVSAISEAARRRPLRVGGFEVTADMLPGIIDPRHATGADAFYQLWSAEVGDLLAAANGLTVTPVPQLASYLGGFTDPTVSATDHGSASTALECADRAAPRDPEFYWNDIQDHLAAEPFYGPLRRNITPCAFWPVAPIEPPTTIDNHHGLLMVGGTGDPAVPYAGQLRMHQALHGSRMLTLDGSFRHVQYLEAGNACVDSAVENYLLGAPLPSHDLSCHAG